MLDRRFSIRRGKPKIRKTLRQIEYLNPATAHRQQMTRLRSRIHAPLLVDIALGDVIGVEKIEFPLLLLGKSADASGDFKIAFPIDINDRMACSDRGLDDSKAVFSFAGSGGSDRYAVLAQIPIGYIDRPTIEVILPMNVKEPARLATW